MARVCCAAEWEDCGRKFGDIVSMICPDCDKGVLTLNDNCLCRSCKAKFIKIEETVYVNENALQKAAEIAEETDKRLGEIIKKERRRKQGAPIGGGLPFELQARKALADILVGAVEDVKKRLAEAET